MAQNSWPSPSHNSRAVTDVEFEQLASPFTDNGILGDPRQDPIVTAGAGLSVNVRANTAGSLRGHFWTSGSGDNLAVAANASGQTRVDLVVLRLNRADWTVRAAIRQGTPGAGAPALVQDPPVTGLYEIALAQVTVLSGAAGVTVTRNELYLGSRVRALTSTTPNPTASPGELQYETDTGHLSLYEGPARRTVYGYSGDIVVNATVAGWSIVVDSALERRTGSVHLRLGQFARTGGNLAGAADSRLPILIPATFRHPTRNQYATCYITGARIGRITIYPANHAQAGQAVLTQKPDLTNADDVLPGSCSWVVD